MPVFWGVIAAMAVTPLAAAVYTVGMHLTSPGARGAELSTAVSAGLAMGTMGAVVAGLYVAVYGVPAFYALRSLGIANIFTCALVAVLPWVILFHGEPMKLVWFTWQALASALAFWYFARQVVVHAAQGG